MLVNHIMEKTKTNKKKVFPSTSQEEIFTLVEHFFPFFAPIPQVHTVSVPKVTFPRDPYEAFYSRVSFFVHF